MAKSIIITIKAEIISIIVMSLILSSIDATHDNDNLVKDDECVDIAMRPLPRFGKRSLNTAIDRLRRSCIINRRQTKSLSLDSAKLNQSPFEQYDQPSIESIGNNYETPTWQSFISQPKSLFDLQQLTLKLLLLNELHKHEQLKQQQQQQQQQQQEQQMQQQLFYRHLFGSSLLPYVGPVPSSSSSSFPSSAETSLSSSSSSSLSNAENQRQINDENNRNSI